MHFFDFAYNVTYGPPYKPELSKLLERKIKKHEKKYRLIAEPRDLIKNNNRARIFP